jgi:hypothetical protein
VGTFACNYERGNRRVIVQNGSLMYSNIHVLITLWANWIEVLNLARSSVHVIKRHVFHFVAFEPI